MIQEDNGMLFAMKRRTINSVILPPAGFEPVAPWSEVWSATHSASPAFHEQVQRWCIFILHNSIYLCISYGAWIQLTYFNQPKSVTGKQCRLRPDAAERGISVLLKSGSRLPGVQMGLPWKVKNCSPWKQILAFLEQPNMRRETRHCMQE